MPLGNILIPIYLSLFIQRQELMRTLWFLSSQMHLSEQMIIELTSFFSFGYRLLYCALYK